MNKPRAPSDPIPTSEPYNDHEQTFSSTLPSRVPREQRIAEPFPAISATALLGMDVSHSGWVRKEGYGYRSWKNRFMVLHHGCIYYFKETNSNSAKGKFALNEYRCLPAGDRDRADRYPYVFKLVPDDEQRRTYYISSPSKSEMEGWMKSINIDIQLYCPSEYDYVDEFEVGKSKTCPTIPKTVPILNKRDAGNHYNSGYSHGTFSQSLSTCSIFEKPAPLLPPKPGTSNTPLDNDVDDVYEPVDGYFNSEGHYVAVINDNSTAPQQTIHITRPANNNKPLPIPPPRPADMREDSESGDDSEDEPLYLDLKKEQEKNENRLQSPKNDVSQTGVNRERPVPTPRVQNGPENTSEDVDVTYLSVIGNDAFDGILPKPKPLPKCSPKPPARKARSFEDKKEFDYLPTDCFKPEMPKNQAKVFLELTRNLGVYIVNASQTSDTKMSLSVWLTKGVRHFLIFKRQEMYTLDPSLSRDEHFSDLKHLIKYYYTHPLPKCGEYLKAPFAAASK